MVSVVCVSAEGYEGSLRVGETYEALADKAAARRGFIPVRDDTEEDYLFLASRFRPAAPPRSVDAADDEAGKARQEHVVASPTRGSRR